MQSHNGWILLHREWGEWGAVLVWDTLVDIDGRVSTMYAGLGWSMQGYPFDERI